MNSGIHTATTKSYLAMINAVSICYYVSVCLEEHSSEISRDDHRVTESQVMHFSCFPELDAHCFIIQSVYRLLGMVGHTCNPSIQEAEAGRLL